jgi:DnaJ-class molecular chaperone
MHKCSICSGTGKMLREVKVKDKMKKIEMKCKECEGSGFAGRNKCPICGG